MHLTLIGTRTSPYVRRLRLYLDEIPHEFEAIDYMAESKDDIRLTKANPIKRVPVLLVDGEPLWESRIIYQFLARAFARHVLTLDEENIQSAIDGWQDSLILPFLMQRMGQTVDLKSTYWLRQMERQSELMTYLGKAISEHRIESWDYPAMSLWSLLDWAEFRNLLSLEKSGKHFQRFFALHSHHGLNKATDPRLV